MPLLFFFFQLYSVFRVQSHPDPGGFFVTRSVQPSEPSIMDGFFLYRRSDNEVLNLIFFIDEV